MDLAIGGEGGKEVGQILGVVGWKWVAEKHTRLGRGGNLLGCRYTGTIYFRAVYGLELASPYANVRSASFPLSVPLVRPVLLLLSPLSLSPYPPPRVTGFFASSFFDAKKIYYVSGERRNSRISRQSTSRFISLFRRSLASNCSDKMVERGHGARSVSKHQTG